MTDVIEMDIGECTKLVAQWEDYKACRNNKLNALKDKIETLLANDWTSPSADEYKKIVQQMIDNCKEAEQTINKMIERLQKAIDNQQKAADKLGGGG